VAEQQGAAAAGAQGRVGDEAPGAAQAERLPVDAQPAASAPDDGDNALIVGPLTIP
jgi:hypothetical protein